jgi:hypothetical protein
MFSNGVLASQTDVETMRPPSGTSPHPNPLPQERELGLDSEIRPEH